MPAPRSVWYEERSLDILRKLSRHKRLFPGSRPALLLVSLFSLLAIYPWFESRSTGGQEDWLGGLALHTLFTLVLLGGAWLVHDRRVVFLVACLLGVPGLFLGWWDHWLNMPNWIDGLGALSLAAFILFVALSQIGFILRAPRVTTDVLCRAIAVYLMLGVAWTAMYAATELLIPGSFSAKTVVLHGLRNQLYWSDLLYFSFCTISTLGPGDIVAESNHARSLVVLECVVGPLYLTVLIARLVAMYRKPT